MSVDFYVPSFLDAHEDDSLTVNMNNGNAARVIEALGYPVEAEDGERLVGSDSGESFLGHVLLALALTPEDAGVPAAERPGPGARWIDCGRREGYLQEKLGELHELAVAAARVGEEVCWA